jgi:hypothetical protein
MMERADWREVQAEGSIYRPGQKVELKHRPGVIDTVIAYDPMMVPPVILAIDPQPRYPEELTLISAVGTRFNWLHSWTRDMPSSASVSVRASKTVARSH